jgi:hypothetical protein
MVENSNLIIWEIHEKHHDSPLRVIYGLGINKKEVNDFDNNDGLYYLTQSSIKPLDLYMSRRFT